MRYYHSILVSLAIAGGVSADITGFNPRMPIAAATTSSTILNRLGRTISFGMPGGSGLRELGGMDAQTQANTIYYAALTITPPITPTGPLDGLDGNDFNDFTDPGDNGVLTGGGAGGSAGGTDPDGIPPGTSKDPTPAVPSPDAGLLGFMGIAWLLGRRPSHGLLV